MKQFSSGSGSIVLLHRLEPASPPVLDTSTCTSFARALVASELPSGRRLLPYNQRILVQSSISPPTCLSYRVTECSADEESRHRVLHPPCSHDWEELIGEILLEYGINRYEPKFRRDERQTHELAPFPTVQEVQARMSSARERGVRPGYLSGTNPWQTIANIQRFAHAVNEARGASRPSSRTGEIDVRTKQNAAVLRTLRAKAGETADIEKEMAAIEADLEHEARRTKRALDRRGMFEPEMNEVRVRTMQRVAHRDRIMQQRAGPARAQHLSHAAQGETAQKRSRNAVGVLDRLDALLKVIDAGALHAPAPHAPEPPCCASSPLPFLSVGASHMPHRCLRSGVREAYRARGHHQ